MRTTCGPRGHCGKPREITPGAREQAGDLNDYLDLLEARARNKGKRTFTTEEVRREIGLASRRNTSSRTA
jgi:hypothetical protein